MRRCLVVLISLAFLLIFPLSVLASAFQLKTVGALDVDGVTYDHLWYTNESVTFTGIGLENTQVTVVIDGVSETTTADSSGNWSYSTTLSAGDHQVSFTSQGSTISLILTIGELPGGVGSLSTAETPTAGVATPTIIILASGIFLIVFPFIYNLLLRKKVQAYKFTGS